MNALIVKRLAVIEAAAALGHAGDDVASIYHHIAKLDPAAAARMREPLSELIAALGRAVSTLEGIASELTS